jgi:hypothetical protein
VKSANCRLLLKTAQNMLRTTELSAPSSHDVIRSKLKMSQADFAAVTGVTMGTCSMHRYSWKGRSVSQSNRQIKAASPSYEKLTALNEGAFIEAFAPLEKP